MAVAALEASVLLALVGPRTAEAAFPGKNGKIAYSAFDIFTSHRQIYTVPLPSSGATATPVAGKTGGYSPNWGVSTRR